MNKRIMTITTIMIIVLILVLVFIYLTYIKKEPVDISTKNNISGDSIELIEPANTPVNLPSVSSGDIDTDIPKITPTIEPTAVLITDKPIRTTNSPAPTQIVEIVETHVELEANSGDEIDNQVSEGTNIVGSVISSNNETSNQDKQQVLSEIDDALQGLLEAVGKVPTVNEEKLNMTLENGEV